jgi:uncharacterized protein YccT (UPF0319 family)
LPLHEPTVEEPLIGAAAVERALAQFEAAVEARFDAALATFDAYAPGKLAEPALAALRWTVLARQAEALLRFGRKADARRIWTRLLREDRLSVPVLKNVAVALTGGTGTGRELAAWRDYCEMLYVRAVVDRSTRRHAGAIAAFHRDFGAAYAPSCLQADGREEPLTDAEETDLVSFLNAPARVGTYVDHTHLDWLGRELDFGSPTLVLLVRFMAVMRENFLARLTAFLTDTTGDEAMKALREAQLARLSDEWLESPSVRGNLAVVHFFIHRLQSASASAEHDQVFKLALTVLRSDDRRPRVAELAIVSFHEAAKASARSIPHDALAREGRAWIARARAHLASQDLEQEDAEEQELTADGIESVGEALASVLMDACVMESAALGAGVRMKRVEKTLVELVAAHPRALRHRMIKYWNLMADACNNERRDEGLHWAVLCARDADAFIANPATAAEVLKEAREFQARIKDITERAGAR